MKSLAIKIVINALAVWAAAGLVDGIMLRSGVGSILVVAVIFGVVNAVLKPIAKLLTFPIIVVTLGLFTLVINAGLLLITDFLSVGLEVSGFGSAILGAIITSIVSWGLSIFLPDDD